MLRPARVGMVPELQRTSEFVLHLCTTQRPGKDLLGKDLFAKQEAGNRWQKGLGGRIQAMAATCD